MFGLPLMTSFELLVTCLVIFLIMGSLWLCLYNYCCKGTKVYVKREKVRQELPLVFIVNDNRTCFEIADTDNDSIGMMSCSSTDEEHEDKKRKCDKRGTTQNSSPCQPSQDSTEETSKT